MGICGYDARSSMEGTRVAEQRQPGKEALGKLDDLPLFAKLDPATRAAIVDEALLRNLDVGDLLIRQGAPNRCLYLVLEGRLGIFVQALATEPVAVVEPGETVGEMSVLEHGPAEASVMALEACRVVVLSEAAFWKLITASHEFSVSLLQKLAQRLRASDDSVARASLERSDYERAAMYDGLTGVYNRRWADASLERFVAKGLPFSIVVLDVDHFEKFNEEHGRAAGDYVLTKVAALFTQTLRGTDFVARYGDAEFILVLPKAKAESAAMVTERVRRALAAVAFEMKDGTVLPRVTISAGVAEFEPGQGVSELVSAAKRALFEAKKRGHNRVEVA